MEQSVRGLASFAGNGVSGRAARTIPAVSKQNLGEAMAVMSLRLAGLIFSTECMAKVRIQATLCFRSMRRC
eukprot:499555-Alexandrium_andersonii.AAC.1